MERILVADDGSDFALRAIETAALLAAQSNAELIALAIVDASRFRQADILTVARSEKLEEAGAIEVLIAGSAQYLDRCDAMMTRSGVARFRKERHASDDTAAAIIEFASAHSIDLIVVGSRGRSRLRGLLLGSVSQKLAAHASCSVLIVR